MSTIHHCIVLSIHDFTLPTVPHPNQPHKDEYCQSRRFYRASFLALHHLEPQMQTIHHCKVLRIHVSRFFSHPTQLHKEEQFTYSADFADFADFADSIIILALQQLESQTSAIHHCKLRSLQSTRYTRSLAPISVLENHPSINPPIILNVSNIMQSTSHTLMLL